MSSSVRTCPRCHALQPPEARSCRLCGQPLPPDGDAQVSAAVPAPPTAPSFPTSPEVIAYAQSYRQPVTEPLPALGALAALSFLGGAIAAVVSGEPAFVYVAGLTGSTCLLTLLFLWLAGWNNRRRGAEFLQSGRPLVAWVYTPEEWQQVRQYFYEHMRSDSPPYGCLPILFGGIGLLVGVMVGITDSRDLVEAAVSVVVGAFAGATVGGLLVLPVYLLNWSAVERLRHPTPPACVALGSDELFYERVYLDTRWHPIDAILLKHRPLPHLEVIRHLAGGITNRLSVTFFFPSVILIPPRMVSAVQEAILHIRVRA
ncbi:MAG: zinc ribbon domain-containing protein [Roseiflexus sp.]|nr:zinc ribbon domain-containing protein [Roseiflexus sp.]